MAGGQQFRCRFRHLGDLTIKSRCMGRFLDRIYGIFLEGICFSRVASLAGRGTGREGVWPTEQPQRLSSRALFAFLSWSLGLLIRIGLVGSLGSRQHLADEMAERCSAQCQHWDQEQVFLFEQEQQNDTDKAAQTEADDASDDAT